MITQLLNLPSGFLFIEFLISAGVILFAGRILSILGDEISERTSLTKGWVGYILLSFITSLPELATGVGAVAIAGKPNILFGDILGSNSFNFIVIALSGFFVSQWSHKFSPSQVTMKSAFFLIQSMVLLFLVLSSVFSLKFGILYSLAIFVVYLLLTNEVRGKEEEESVEAESDEKAPWLKFTAVALVVVASGVWMILVAEKISITPFHIFGKTVVFGETFIGFLLVAIATSLPELSVGITSAVIGSPDMLFGMIIGSNMFNLTIISVSDIFAVFKGGSVWDSLYKTNVLAGVWPLIIGALALNSLAKKSGGKKTVSIFDWLVIGTWILSVYSMFAMRSF